MHCNTNYKHYSIFSVLILTASRQQYIATVVLDSVKTQLKQIQLDSAKTNIGVCSHSG